MSAGKVSLGAFRTYPKVSKDGPCPRHCHTRWYLTLQGYKPLDEGPGEYQTIPLEKIEDFGVHCKQ